MKVTLSLASLVLFSALNVNMAHASGEVSEIPADVAEKIAEAKRDLSRELADAFKINGGQSGFDSSSAKSGQRQLLSPLSLRPSDLDTISEGMKISGSNSVTVGARAQTLATLIAYRKVGQALLSASGASEKALGQSLVAASQSFSHLFVDSLVRPLSGSNGGLDVGEAALNWMYGNIETMINRSASARATYARLADQVHSRLAAGTPPGQAMLEAIQDVYGFSRFWGLGSSSITNVANRIGSIQ